MDHDAMHRDVQGLKKFRQEAEEAIAFYKGLKAAGGPNTEPSDDQLTRLHDEINKALAEPVSSIEQRLTALEGRSTGVELAPEFLDRMEQMLTWFDGNKEGLEVLLSLDGEPDANDDGQPASTDQPEQAPADPAAATGEGSNPNEPAAAPDPAASQPAS